MSPLMGNAASIFNGTDAIVNYLSKREHLQYFNRVADSLFFIVRLHQEKGYLLARIGEI